MNMLLTCQWMYETIHTKIRNTNKIQNNKNVNCICFIEDQSKDPDLYDPKYSALQYLKALSSLTTDYAVRLI